MAVCVRDAKEHHGYTKVVLAVGGGAALLGIKVSGVAFGRDAGEPLNLTEVGLILADGALLAAHIGRCIR